MLFRSEHVPGLAQARALCTTIGPDAAVLALDSPARQLTRTIAALCPAEVGAVIRRVDASTLAVARRAAAARGRRLVVISSRPGLIPFRDSRPRASVAYWFSGWQEAMVRAPRKVKRWRPAYWVAVVGPDGRATSA